MSKKRLYFVSTEASYLLVWAYSRHQALQFVAAQTIKCELAEQGTIVKYITEGLKAQDATAPENSDMFGED